MNSAQSFYIHWPFCPYRCHFCPFVALAGHDQYMGEYHEALMAEICSYSRSCSSKLPIRTIFIGGGTPSTYPPNLLLDMFGTLRREFSIDSHSEITLEVNPGTITTEKVAAWRDAGINRLSIGVQSLRDDLLQGLNRHQSIADVYHALDCTSQLFEAISIDLIIGLPGVTVEDWKKTIRTVIDWPIMHLSIYFLTVHEQTPLYYSVQKKRTVLPPDDEVIDLYLWSLEMLEAAGFERYEVSNFARRSPDRSFRSHHNMIYWDRLPYKGFGLGAWSFDGSIRSHNEKNLTNYCSRAQRSEEVTVFSEEITPYQVWFERVMLGLRRAEGVAIDLLTEQCDLNRLNGVINELCSAEYALLRDGTLVLTHKGLAVENEIVVRITQSAKSELN